jgi:Leucine-rich repeat (LRR) protein
MHRIANALAVLVAGCGLSLLPGTALAGPFADKNLEAAVRATLMDTKPELSDESLRNLFVLHADGKDIKDLTGLEKCTNLLELKLAKNQVADLKPLAPLTNLQSLDLANNKVSDLAPLAKLTKLQYLQWTTIRSASSSRCPA